MACLDLHGPLLVESVLHELHRIIDFDTGGYFYPGADGGLDAYIEPSIARESLHTYFDPQLMATEQQVIRRSAHDFAAAVRGDHGTQVMEELLKVTPAQFMRSDFYNLVLRPAELLDCLSLVLRTPSGQGVGALKLYRRPGATRFAPEDVAMLGRLEPWLARTLQPGETDTDDTVLHDSAVLIVTPGGQLLWTSQQAEQLMALAFGPRWYRRSELPPALHLLLQRLQSAQRLLHGGAAAAVPQLELHNASGWFLLRAAQMTAASGSGQAVSLHITQRTARVARLLPALRKLGLPQRQHELAYWLVRGLPEDRIAARMGITANTATYHRRQIYTRLGVQSRQELQDLFFAPP